MIKFKDILQESISVKDNPHASDWTLNSKIYGREKNALELKKLNQGVSCVGEIVYRAIPTLYIPSSFLKSGWEKGSISYTPQDKYESWSFDKDYAIYYSTEDGTQFWESEYVAVTIARKIQNKNEIVFDFTASDVEQNGEFKNAESEIILNINSPIKVKVIEVCFRSEDLVGQGNAYDTLMRQIQIARKNGIIVSDLKGFERDEDGNLRYKLNEQMMFAANGGDAEYVGLFSNASETTNVVGFGEDQESYDKGCSADYLISFEKFRQLADIVPDQLQTIISLLKSNDVYFGYNSSARVSWWYDVPNNMHYFYDNV